MLYNQRPIIPIIFNPSERMRDLINNPPEFDENTIDKMEGEIFTDLYYPQDPNIIHDRYKVSNMGRVYDTFSNCFITNSFNSGYDYFNLSTIGDNYNIEFKKYRANRVVLSSFNPNENMCNLHVHHKNNITTDNTIDNLQWVTPNENIDYAMQDGRFQLISRQEDLPMVIANSICEFVKDGGTPEEAGVKYNVSDRLVYEIVSGERLPFLAVRYNLPKIENKYKTRTKADSITKDIAKLIKQDIVDGIPEAEIMRKYRQPRYIISDIRHGRTYKNVDIGVELPEIKSLQTLTVEKADYIGQLFSQGKSLKEIKELSGFDEHTILDIKRGSRFPEIKEKYNLDDVKKYNKQLTDDCILREVIPVLLSKEYHNDKEVAEIFDCSAAQIRDLRLHRRRKHLTEGVDFTDCYEPSVRKTHVLKPLEILKICKYIQENPKMPYDEIVKNLIEEIPNITYKLCQDIKLRKTHVNFSNGFQW